MKNFKYLVLSAFMLQGCFPDFKSKESDRLYLKEINESNLKIDWFFYSTVSNTTPDYLIAYKRNKIDTICISDNIADVKFVNSSIEISFYGKPTCYGKSVSIPEKIFNFEVEIDSSHIVNEPKERKYYKKK